MKRILSVLFLFVAVAGNAQIISTIAGDFIYGYSGDGGTATSAKLSYPSTVAVDRIGNVYFSDKNNNVIRKIDTLGIITTVAGNGSGAGYGSSLDSGGYTGDGGQATGAEFRYPWAVAADAHGNLYIADRGNNVVRKVSTTGIITTFAGNGYGAGLGYGGYSGDGGPATAAEFYFPSAVAVDDTGNVYIGDSYNHVIRKVDTAGILHAFAGNHYNGYSGDGGLAVFAKLSDPYGIAPDKRGNVYIADRNNSVIRKVDAAGVITTFAGSHSFGYGGDGGTATAATMSYSDGVAIDSVGNVYFVDVSNSVIRKVDTSGIISTYVGRGTTGHGGDGGLADSAQLNNPLGVATDRLGNLYIADDSNSAVRKVNPNAATLNQLNYLISGVLDIFPNPASTLLNVSSASRMTTITINNISGQIVHKHEYSSERVQVDVSNLPAGIYVVRINGTEVRKFVKQ